MGDFRLEEFAVGRTILNKFRIVGIGNYYYGENFQKFYRSKTGTILLQVEISILQFSNFHRYKIFLFKFRNHPFRIFFRYEENRTTLCDPSRGNRRMPRSIIRVQRKRPKNIFNPLLPLTLCKYKRNLLQINEKIYIPPVEYILVEGFYQEEYFDSTLKQTCVYIRVCKYHALFYHPPPSLPTGQRKNSPSVFTFIQVNIHVCSLYVIRSLDI